MLPQCIASKRRRSSSFSKMLLQVAVTIQILSSCNTSITAFIPMQHHKLHARKSIRNANLKNTLYQPIKTESTSRLNVWFFSGTEDDCDDESCDLVPVRIDRTSANSRRIGGEITVDTKIDDVWAILTDYDRLAIHVPNLVQSKRVRRGNGEQGDGTYQCRLFQEGAQKIFGFEFGATVTMEMQEKFVGSNQRSISFKCVDSPFFSEFDGEWRVESSPDGISTTLNYLVDVRPKGPVPVAALEWRIREDVPTNLRAVKRAAIITGLEGVMRSRALPMKSSSNGVRSRIQQNVNSLGKKATAEGERAMRIVDTMVGKSQRQLQPVPVEADWEAEETMAVYLDN